MKRIMLLAVLFFIPLFLSAADLAPVSAAFKAGNASGLATSFDAEVDMAVAGASKKCDAKGAVDMLNTFFASNKPTAFTIVHNADKKESGFIVAKLTTAKGEFRVNISYRTDNGKALIQSIRIE